MHDNIHDNLIIKPSFTWSDNYILPYESLWSIKAKFCFLNAESWYWFERQKNLIDYNSNESKKISYASLDDTADNDLHIDETMTIRICPICMEYGYHSNIHQSLLLKHCFLHTDTELVTVSNEDLKSSRSGTYEFIDIRTENLIKNEFLKAKINSYLRERVEICRMWAFCRNHNEENIYESTKEIVERFYFQMSIPEMYNCKKLLEIEVKDVPTINGMIYNDIVNNLAYDNFVRYACHSVEEYTKYVRLNMELPDDTYTFRFNGSSSAYYMESLASKKIEENFYNRQEFIHLATVMDDSNSFQNERGEYDISKIAAYMTLCCMIDCRDACDYYRLNGKWRNFNNPCNYATTLTSDLSGYRFGEYAYDSCLENGSLFITKAILDDFFEYVRNDLMNQMSDGVLDYKGRISEISNSNINEPEYVVIRYPDSWSIFGCYPESS